MVSQFVSSHNVKLLGDLKYNFPTGIHAVGRLDKYSEGLLLLTTNKAITRLLFQNKTQHIRTYLVQVNGLISGEKLQKLSSGVSFLIKGGELYTTKPCFVNRSNPFPDNTEGKGEVYYSSSWFTIDLTEGKYHQVRKMVKAIGHKCLRLVRIGIEDILLNNLLPGEVVEISESNFFSFLRIKK